ncbi:MAG: hypothetical protein OXG96_14985 [Acidobacteria bacterium]|nr:hypothetical protein [Acidobacteriota bacterium]
MFSKASSKKTTTFSGFITIRAIYADSSYWSSDAQGGSTALGLLPMTVDAFEKAVEKRLAAILESVRKIKAKTPPTHYRAWIAITARYTDGRQAQRFLDKTVDSQIKLIDLVESWVATALIELREIGRDDI